MQHEHNAYLLLPRMRVQNLNAISSPLTWGAPSITAALGFMYALQRKIPFEWEIDLVSIGMVIHSFEPQVHGRFEKKFNLTRNPISTREHKKNIIGEKGETKVASIVEEGRAHATLSLVIGLKYESKLVEPDSLQERAKQIHTIAEAMRFAGGSFTNSISQWDKPQIILFGETNEFNLITGSDALAQKYQRIKRSLLPGFALISRDELLYSHHIKMQQQNPDATTLDALLDISRINYQYTTDASEDNNGIWKSSRNTGDGWLVPIPVGFTALSDLHDPGSVLNSRDPNTHFRFVESLYSIGEWRSPHHMETLQELLWYSYADHESGLYRCINQGNNN